MPHPVAVTQGLSQPPGFAPQIHGLGAGRAAAWAQHERPLAKGDVTTVTTGCPTSLRPKPELEPQNGTNPQGDQPATWQKIGYFGPFPFTEKGVVCPRGKSH